MKKVWWGVGSTPFQVGHAARLWRCDTGLRFGGQCPASEARYSGQWTGTCRGPKAGTSMAVGGAVGSQVCEPGG